MALIAGTTALALMTAACSGPAAESSDPTSGNLTYWFWAEPDVPGSTDWMKDAIARYEDLNPNVTIDLVPQATETLQGAFQTAAQAESGPDIAMQWATLPVLTPAWQGQAAPLTGLIAEDEMANWLNTDENLSGGEVWAMPLYLLGVPFVWNKELFEQAGIDPSAGPQTWDELLAMCEQLKAAGITPIAVGDKDGAFGAWFQGVVGTQNLDSVTELKDVYAGNADFADEKYSGYLTLLQELVDKGYISSDASSIDASEAWQGFAQGEAAMTWSTDGNVASWIKAGLGDKLGVQATPKVGTGELANYYDATQSISTFITSWSPHKEAAAAFLTWLHEPENLDSWYEATGAFPADSRFSIDKIQDPLMQQLYALDTLPKQLWAENYAPPQVDSQGLRSVGQAVVAGSSTAEEATAEIKRVIESWRTQQVDAYQSYQKWASE